MAFSKPGSQPVVAHDEVVQKESKAHAEPQIEQTSQGDNEVEAYQSRKLDFRTFMALMVGGCPDLSTEY